MKNREKKSIIIWFLLTLFIFISFIALIYIYIYPSILIIEAEKKILGKNITKLRTLKEKWFNFKDFKDLNSTYSSKWTTGETNKKRYKDEELYEKLNEQFYKKIYATLSEAFYDNSIYNWNYKNFILSKSNSTFQYYLNNIIKRLEQIKQSEKFNNRKWNLSVVLPKYSNYIELDSSKNLTDLKFINFVENLLKRFNLKTTSLIGIKDILSVNNNIITIKDNIYYIPLKLDITWTKLGILNFLEYVKSSWSIEFSENGFKFLNKNWEISQLIEVNRFEIKEYIDSGLKKRTSIDTDLKNFLSQTWQNNDILEAKIDLNFYINSISSEKITNKVNNIIWNNITELMFDQYGKILKDKKWKDRNKIIRYNYYNILKIVKKLKSNIILQKNWYYNKKVNNIFLYLNNKNLKKDIDSIKKELKKSKKINSIYAKALKYKEIFSKLDREIYMIVKSLNIKKEKIYSENYIFK
jgi:hypothetical protein